MQKAADHAPIVTSRGDVRNQPRAMRAPVAGLMLATALAATAACGPRVPAAPRPTTPTPRPAATPGTPAAGDTTAPAPTGTGGAWFFAWAPGYVQYVATTQAVVRVEGDTLPRTLDSVATRARLSLRVAPSNAPRLVAATVDSFLVSPGIGRPFESVLRIPLVLQGELAEGRTSVTFADQQPMITNPCTGPELTLLALARDLTPRLPGQLARRQRWTDSSTHALCRSGVPLTVASRHDWRVEGESVPPEGGPPLVHLVRESQSQVSGTGSGRRAGASITGTARATTEYWLDAATGRVARVLATSAADLTILERPDARPLRTTQEGRQDVIRIGS